MSDGPGDTAGDPAAPDGQPDPARPGKPADQGDPAGAGPGPPPLTWRAKWQLVGGRKLLVFTVVMAMAIGTVSALAGGIVGGYLAFRDSGGLPEPGFSLGPVPPALR